MLLLRYMLKDASKVIVYTGLGQQQQLQSDENWLAVHGMNTYNLHQNLGHKFQTFAAHTHARQSTHKEEELRREFPSLCSMHSHTPTHLEPSECTSAPLSTSSCPRLSASSSLLMPSRASIIHRTMLKPLNRPPKSGTRRQRK